MGRFKKLVESKEAMEKFIVDYRIPSNVGLRYCEEGEWHFMRQRGEVVILMIAFIEGGMTILMGSVTRDYLRHFRLVSTQCAVNMFRILGCVDALNEKMGLRLCGRLIQCLLESSKGLNKNFLIVSGGLHDGFHCPTEEGAPGGVFRVGED